MHGESRKLQPTPVDEISKLPYLFAPDDKLLPYVASRKRPKLESGEPLWDLNHNWHEEKLVKAHLNGLGSVLRRSRTQQVFRIPHNNYHDYYGGPPLPKTVSAMYGIILLQLAEYIPPVSLDMKNANPRWHLLKGDEIDRFHQSGEVGLEAPGVQRNFVIGQVVSQEVDISPSNRDLLLSGEDPAYDSDVMGAAVRIMLDQVGASVSQETRDTYRHGYNKGLIHPDAPPTCEQFTFNYLAGNLESDILPYANTLQQQVQTGHLG